MSSVAVECTPTAAVAVVGFEEPEIASLEGILKQPDSFVSAGCIWKLHRQSSVEGALEVLGRGSIPIVICDGDRMPWGWKELLRSSPLLPRPPLQIVTSRLANEYLWAEALNLGAYDVLARPFDATEVHRSVTMAWQRWRHRYGVACDRQNGCAGRNGSICATMVA